MGKTPIAVQKCDVETGIVLATYTSINEVARANFTDKAGIRNALNGKWKQSAGYKWKKVK